MEFSSAYASVALTLVAGKLSYTHVKNWWNAKSLKERYIVRAATLQNLHETITQAEDLTTETEVEQLLEKRAVGMAVRHKGYFRHYLVQSGQAKFGCPVRSEANRLVVRKYLYEVCVERGLIARHINDHVDIATELVFIPSREQLTALAIPHTGLSVIRHKVNHDLGGPRADLA